HHRPGQLGVGAGRHGHPRSGPHPLPPASGHRAARRRVEEGEQGVGKAAGGHRLIGATDLRGRLHAGLFINAVREASRMIEIQPMNPEQYRQQTRTITLAILALFVLLALTSATLAVKLFGEPGGNNFRWNLAGVLTGLAATVAVVRLKFWSTPWMAPAVYGWRLKRSLMRVTNQMHQVQAGVAAGDPEAMMLLRFIRLGLTQMLQLDGNLAELSQMVREIVQHREAMEGRGLDIEQGRLDPDWLEAVKRWGGKAR